MKLFLTSSIRDNYEENGIRVPCALDESNNFLNNLRRYWPTNPKCLVISSDPENDVVNDSFKEIFKQAFKMSNFELDKIDICDKRNEDKLFDMIYDYNILLFAGGHVPTQNEFFKRIHLKELMKDYKGIVIGISAGTMNCADVVYAQPELEGEAVDPKYKRYLDGLNLTKINILPHFQCLKNITLDGLRVLEDISLEDSKTRPFYALVDGAYILIDENKSTLYGEAYLIKDGTITQVCENNKSIEL